MTQVYYPGRPRPQEDMPDERQHRRELAQQLAKVEQGRVDCTLAVTLDAGTATTTIIDSRISIVTAPLLIAMTASAAAEIAAGLLFIVPEAGQAVITHTNSGVTDRTFQCALLG